MKKTNGKNGKSVSGYEIRIEERGLLVLICLDFQRCLLFCLRSLD